MPTGFCNDFRLFCGFFFWKPCQQWRPWRRATSWRAGTTRSIWRWPSIQVFIDVVSFQKPFDVSFAVVVVVDVVVDLVLLVSSFFFCSATSFASVPSAAGHGVADDARGVADAATGGGARLGVSAAARDHGRLCALPLQDPARLARPGAALGRQRYRKTDELRTS